MFAVSLQDVLAAGTIRHCIVHVVMSPVKGCLICDSSVHLCDMSVSDTAAQHHLNTLASPLCFDSAPSVPRGLRMLLHLLTIKEILFYLRGSKSILVHNVTMKCSLVTKEQPLATKPHFFPPVFALISC